MDSRGSRRTPSRATSPSSGVIQELAGEKNATAPQIALAWVLARGRDIVPIPGTKRRAYLEENLEASDLTLSAEDLTRIEALFPREAVQGPRYPDRIMTFING